jgi:hypothetical protein
MQESASILVSRRVLMTQSLASSRAAYCAGGGDSGSLVGLHNGNGHRYRPTSISIMIWILIQDITYLAICYLCSSNEHTGIF